MKKVMVFGVFDGVHEGHRAFLREAKKCGDYLIAVLAPDHIVEHLKGRRPKINLVDRMEHLENEDYVDEVVIGDPELSTWQVVEKYKPDIVACGFDQKALKDDLEANLKKLSVKPEIKVMKSYEPNIYHSTILNE